mmetsp:Transcript_161245/g.297199  ORF Transcript_161245/g.297199 Transcript_161245/m.297199 type:complete len:1093 (+) Transcript_161245:123-3401(+)
MTASTDFAPIGVGAALAAGGPGATMVGANALPGPATGVRAQTPEATPLDESSLCRQKRSPGAPRPASRTPIGTPTPERQTENEMSHANSWSLWDPFGSQEACRPNSAPLEQRQFSNMTPETGKDVSPARSTANAASVHSPSVAANMPDLQTFHHPQPRRLQSVTPLLESEATTAASAKALLPLSPEHSTGLGAEKVTALTLTAPPKMAAGPATHHEHQEDIAARRGEPFTSTPSPEREGFGASNEDWAESPHPVMAHRSVQNTPEPTHYSQYNYGTGAIGLNGRLAEPISTPSPSVHSNVHHPGGNAHGPYLGVPPRFPDSHEASTVGVGSNASCPLGTTSLSASLGGMPGGSLPGHQGHGHHTASGVLMPPLSSGFSPSSALLTAPNTATAPPGPHGTAPAPQSAANAAPAPSPAGTACAPPRTSASDALAVQLAANAATQGFAAYQMQMDNLDPALLAQVSAAKTPGQVTSQLQAAISQTSHQQLAQQGYQQALQTGAFRPPLGAAGWPMPNCPLPLGFPPAPPQCMGTSFPPVFGPQAGSPGGQAPSNELRPPFLPTPAPVPVGTMPAATPSGSPGQVAGQYVAGNAPAASPAPARSHSLAPTPNPASPSQLGPPHPKETRQPSSSTKSEAASGGPQPAELNELRGQVVQLSKTQAGSKYLQRQLLKGNQQVVDLILHEVEQDVVHLMCDAYGNYLCSVAFQACSVRQRKRMLEKLAPRIAATACDKRGTHALQALITLLGTAEEQDMFMRAVKNHVIELCMDPNGTHVVQRLLFFFMPPFTDSIYIPVVDKMVEVAHHPYGLCVLKKCISQAKTPGTHQDLLLDQLARHALDLVQSPYGNYAIQHALEEWGALRCMLVLKSLEGRMMQLSIQKFSSNVVEKIFCSAPPDMRKRFIDELIESDKMSALVNSNYGHYVVKRALQLAELVQVQALIDGVSTNLVQLPNRRLRAKWEKVLSVGYDRLKGIDVRDPELTNMMNGSNNAGMLNHQGAADYLSTPSPMPSISDAGFLGQPGNGLHAPGPGSAMGAAPGFIGHGLAGLGGAGAAGLSFAGMAGPLQGVASLPPQLQQQWAPWRSSPMALPPNLREQ